MANVNGREAFTASFLLLSLVNRKRTTSANRTLTLQSTTPSPTRPSLPDVTPVKSDGQPYDLYLKLERTYRKTREKLWQLIYRYIRVNKRNNDLPKNRQCFNFNQQTKQTLLSRQPDYQQCAPTCFILTIGRTGPVPIE